MIRRQAFLHKGIRMTGEAVPVEYNEISITRAARPLQLVPPQATVFEVLRAKLGWQVTRPEGM